MQNVVIDRPYEFVPPYRGTIWPTLLRMYVGRYLDRHHGIVRVEHKGVEHLQASLSAGHGIVLAANHCRDCDPLVVGTLSKAAGCLFYLLASWHVFMQSKVQGFLLRRGGAFSIYREGMDRAAVSAATEILETAERPLVIFPEGVISRTNDRLNALMEGAALMARAAAKKRAKLNPPGKVVVHPVAIRYRFHGNLEATLGSVLDRIEARLTWRAQRELPLIERIYKLGRGLLCLKEIEYFGQAQSGDIDQRLGRLIDQILTPLEKEWLNGQREETVVGRVKRLRIAILPDLVKGDIAEEERQRRWRQLADVYLAQQLSNYPADYIASNPTPERLLETVERFEEDLTDVATVHRPMTASVEVGRAIEVAPARGDGAELMEKVEEQLRQLLGIAAEPSQAPTPSHSATV